MWQECITLSYSVPIYSQGNNPKDKINFSKNVYTTSTYGHWKGLAIYSIINDGLATNNDRYTNTEFLGMCNNINVIMLPYPRKVNTKPHVEFERKFMKKKSNCT